MPELPEVETVVRQLRRKVMRKTIVSVDIVNSSVLAPRLRRARSRTIQSVQRRGKTIIFQLDNNQVILSHLRMTGSFAYYTQKQKPRVDYYMGRFCFVDGSSLAYYSIRKFGGLTLLTQQQAEQYLAQFGPEPLDDLYTAQQFVADIKRFPQSPIKNKLLDQHFIAGIGNIYAQEALYKAGINPWRMIAGISTQRLSRLYQAIREILQLAIENNGTSVHNYTNLDGKGSFQNLLSVYTRNSCPKNHPIQKIKMAGRGTYFCARCQR